VIKYVRNLAVVAAAFLCAVYFSMAHAEGLIRLGLQTTPTDVLYQAKDWGQPYGLKAEISTYSSAGDSLKAFLADQVDVVSAGSGRLVTMAAVQPEKFYIIAVNEYGGDRYGLVVAPGAAYKKIGDLKGKKIGVVGGAGSYVTFLVYLKNHNLDAKDFQFVNMKHEDIPAAVSRGVVDAGLVWEPLVAIGEVSGTVTRMVSMKGVSESPNIFLVSRSYAKKHPDNLSKYISTLLDRARLIKDDPKQAGTLVSEQLKKSGIDIKPEAMTLAFARLTVEPQVEMRLLDELTPLAQTMYDAGRIKTVPDFKGLVNTEFYDKAVQLQKTANR